MKTEKKRQFFFSSFGYCRHHYHHGNQYTSEEKSAIKLTMAPDFPIKVESFLSLSLYVHTLYISSKKKYLEDIKSPPKTYTAVFVCILGYEHIGQFIMPLRQSSIITIIKLNTNTNNYNDKDK